MIENLIKSSALHLSTRELLNQPVTILIDCDDNEQKVLKKMHLSTVFDLATSNVFNTAFNLFEASQSKDSILGKNGFASSDMVKSDALSIPIEKLIFENIETLDGIGKTLAKDIADALHLDTIRDLSLWTPFQSAKQIVNYVFDVNNNEDPDAPSELLPTAGEYPTEKVRYRKIFLDEVPLSKNQTLVDISGPIDLSNLDEDESLYQSVAFGAMLSFEQAWYPKGVALGQLLHSLALAPAESTRIAVVDWSRSTNAAVSEEIGQEESLSNEMNQRRAISDITNGVVQEVQEGRSESDNVSVSKSNSTSSSVSGGLLIFTGSKGSVNSNSTNNSHSISVSSSKGSRNVSAESLQDITSSTQQNSASVRTKRASIVKETEQNENETITTRLITNYNHSHPLSMHYYEVVQLYTTRTRVSKVERCVFIPLKLIDFCAINIIDKYRAVLQGAAHNQYTLNLLESSFEEVEMKVQLNTIRGHFSTGSNSPEIRNRLNAEGIFKNNKDLMKMPQGSKLVGYNVYPTKTAPAGFVKKLVFHTDADSIELATKTEVNLADDTHNVLGNPIDVAAIDRISVEFNFDVAKEDEQFCLVNLQFENEGFKFGFPFTLSLNKEDASSGEITLLKVKHPENFEELCDILNQNALHYSRAIWESLNQDSIALLLSKYRINNHRAIDFVDPTPLTTYGNFMVFKYTYGENGADKNWELWKKRHIDLLAMEEDTIPVPTGGVFAEAIMGRYNASEKIDLTRFWNWQDSPIPHMAPEIAALQAGGKAMVDATTTGNLANPVVNIMNPQSLPDPQGMTATMNALMASNIFRDMSGLDATIALTAQGLQTTAEGALGHAKVSSENMKAITEAVTQRLKVVGDTIASIYGKGGSGGSVGGSKNITEAGGKVNLGEKFDAKKKAETTSSGTKTLPNGSSGNGGATSNGTQSSNTSNPTSNYQEQAIDRLLGGDGNVSSNAVPGQSNGETSEVESTNVQLIYDVPLVAQSNKLSCWAASMAMLVSHRTGTSTTDQLIAQEAGISIEQSYSWDHLESVKNHFGFKVVPILSSGSKPTAKQWYDWLVEYGPLWITIQGGPTHAVVVYGIEGDISNNNAILYIRNPWNTSQAFDNDELHFNPENTGFSDQLSISEINEEFEIGDLHDLQFSNWRILYLPSGDN